MVMKRLEDTRIYQAMTIEDGDRLFGELAVLEVRILAKTSSADKRIAEIKQKTAEDTAELESLLARKQEELKEYIKAHPERFEKPRMRKTEFGKYGLRSAEKIVVDDPEAVIRYADDMGLEDLYEVQRKVTAGKVKDALAAGVKVPGVRKISGEVASYTVDRAATERREKAGA